MTRIARNNSGIWRSIFDDRQESDVNTALQVQRLCLMFAGIAAVILPLSGTLDLPTPATILVVAVGLLFTSRMATRMRLAR